MTKLALSIRGGNINPTRQSTTRNSIFLSPYFLSPLQPTVHEKIHHTTPQILISVNYYIRRLGSREDEQQREVLLGAELRRRV